MAFIKSCLYCMLFGIASHYIGEALPRRWFHWDRFPYRDWCWEKQGRIYNALGIRLWKDHLPDLSKLMKDMLPKRVGNCPRSTDVYALVKETCVAELVHWALCLIAPGICLFWDNWIGVLLTIVFILGNLPFILIQRYNRPALVALARRLEAREERKRNACAHSVG